MSGGKRRDKKGRVLYPGEYQDASGKYSYKYKNLLGKRTTVHSWRLVPTDKTPKGKKAMTQKMFKVVWHFIA